MSAGVDELIKIDDEAKEQMDNALYGGLDANENQQKMAEVHFEAWMRLLDSRVTHVSLKEKHSFRRFVQKCPNWRMKNAPKVDMCASHLGFLSSVQFYNAIKIQKKIRCQYELIGNLLSKLLNIR